MIVLSLALILTPLLALPQTILEHLRKTRIAHLQLLFILQVHEIALSDRKIPKKLSKHTSKGTGWSHQLNLWPAQNSSFRFCLLSGPSISVRTLPSRMI